MLKESYNEIAIVAKKNKAQGIDRNVGSGQRPEE